MKQRMLTVSLSIILTIATLSACGDGKVPATDPLITTAAPESTAVITDAATQAQTTVPHRDIVYPDTLDFSDTDAIADIFWMDDLLAGLTTRVDGSRSQIVQSCTINGVDFSLTIGLTKWDGRTTPEQIVQCARTFWYCYPQMYDRFKVKDTPTHIVLNIENEGYEVASTSGNIVHLYDGWLEGNKTDYDCLTHEFAHVVQTNWSGAYVPSDGSDTYMIERFADYCRFIYCYDDGLYNDSVWTLQTSKTEDSYAKGVRFWVWLDYTYSTENIDIMQRMAQAISTKQTTYKATFWRSGGNAWKTIFADTGAAGKTLDDLWEEYAATDLATLSSNRSGRVTVSSPLLKKYPIRETVKSRNPSADDYLR